ncbi:hypothetical protein J2X16_001676 [Pelomonas aquatica]|uniref:Integrase n=1 Tax=Pelomonas aquatica TaxID=431058 RepID=A0ABU1Z6V1_9BURK|nr:hypothetical protein [Pelomonas aquatica]MDR7296337.1 hypothetical protein [Pelomonas aquatica]
MASVKSLPSLENIMAGGAIFAPDSPIWLARFADPVWPFLVKGDPLFRGDAESSIAWADFIHGRGYTYGGLNSLLKAQYTYCLTDEIVADLKIAAAIYSKFPKLIKHAKTGKNGIDPQTVKARIDELAKVFSSAIVISQARYGRVITKLSDISIGLLKEAIAQYPGRGGALKRALKLISDVAVQRNLSAPLKWQLIDIEKGSISWPKTNVGPGIATLTDLHFLFIQDQCIQHILRFKAMMGMPVHCVDVSRKPGWGGDIDLKARGEAVDAYLKGDVQDRVLFERFGIGQRDLEVFICDAQNAAILLILLLTGMRDSETRFLFDDALEFDKGYWFLKSKVIKGRPKSAPVAEGWLAVDITRDAFDVLKYFCSITGNRYLFSSPFKRFAESGLGYAFGSLNTKLGRFLKRIDVEGTYADWQFSMHQCRETLVFQLAKQQVGLPFISIQLKHFHSRFFNMPNEVTAGYGNYRKALMLSVTGRMADARESALQDLYGEDAKFAGGGGEAHKARIDAFFAGKGYFGAARVRYIKNLANSGIKVQPTSIGSCSKNFALPVTDKEPPCYGDFECDPDCDSHVITERGGQALIARRDYLLVKADSETNKEYKVIWIGQAKKIGRHINKLGLGERHGN